MSAQHVRTCARGIARDGDVDGRLEDSLDLYATEPLCALLGQRERECLPLFFGKAFNPFANQSVAYQDEVPRLHESHRGSMMCRLKDPLEDGFGDRLPCELPANVPARVDRSVDCLTIRVVEGQLQRYLFDITQDRSPAVQEFVRPAGLEPATF